MSVSEFDISVASPEIFYKSMDCYNDNIKLDVFRQSTTYQSDYRRYCDYRREVYKQASERSESIEEVNPAPPIDDHESFAKWRDGIHIPFDLLLQPKPIIGTDPHRPFQKLAPIENLQKEEAIRTRPRVYMTPACSMDNIEDPEMRELLCSYMYTTEWRNAEKEATANCDKKKTRVLPDSRNTATTDPVTLQVELYKPIEESFQRKGKQWDNQQLRSFTDPTREFWIHKDPPVLCGACVDPFKGAVPNETKEVISALINDDKLRLAHDYPPSSYAGYKVRLARGVSLSKVDLPTIHPFLSTSQAITSRYAEDLKK